MASRAAASVDGSGCVIFTCVCEAGLLSPAGPTDGVRRLSGWSCHFLTLKKSRRTAFRATSLHCSLQQWVKSQVERLTNEPIKNHIKFSYWRHRKMYSITIKLPSYWSSKRLWTVHWNQSITNSVSILLWYYMLQMIVKLSADMKNTKNNSSKIENSVMIYLPWGQHLWLTFLHKTQKTFSRMFNLVS